MDGRKKVIIYIRQNIQLSHVKMQAYADIKGLKEIQ